MGYLFNIMISLVNFVSHYSDEAIQCLTKLFSTELLHILLHIPLCSAREKLSTFYFDLWFLLGFIFENFGVIRYLFLINHDLIVIVGNRQTK